MLATQSSLIRYLGIAPVVLAGSGPETAVSVWQLLVALQDRSAATRAWAAGRLGRLAPAAPGVVAALWHCAVADAEAQVRQAAQEALGAVRVRAAGQPRRPVWRRFLTTLLRALALPGA
jgi:hypothetical protein